MALDLDAQLLAQAAAADDAIRNRAVRVVNNMLSEIERQMEVAPDATKFSIIQKIFPMLSKQLDTDKTSDELTKLRDELTTLRDEVATALLGDHPLEVGAE